MKKLFLVGLSFLLFIFFTACGGSNGSKGSNVNNYNVNLKTLSVNGGTLSPIFNSDTISYSVEVPNETIQTDITAETDDSSSTLKINGIANVSGSAFNVQFNEGNNTVTIQVTAPDNVTVKTYTININRVAISSNTNLAGISLSDSSFTLSPLFSSSVTEYNIEVPYATGSISISPTSAGLNAAITVNGNTVSSGSVSDTISLSPGGNNITIVVTAESGDIKTYTITVNRTAVNNNANLAGFTLSYGSNTLSPSFSSDITSYSATVPYSIYSITLTPYSVGVGASIKVNGAVVDSGTSSDSISLDAGLNNIYIEVTAQNETTVKTYTVSVTRTSLNFTNYTSNGIYRLTSQVYASDSNIYVATDGCGLFISTDNGISWVNKTKLDGLGEDYVWGVCVSGLNIYAATLGGLSVSSDNGLTWTNYKTTNGLGSNYVNGVYASGSNIYAATSGGLTVSSDSGLTWTNYKTTNGLGSNFVYGVYASGSNIYAATSGGLSVSPNSGLIWTNYKTTNGLGSNRVKGVYASGSNIYAATLGGLSVSTDNGLNWSNIKTTNSIGSNIVNDVYTSGSNIYAATQGGLSISTDSG